MDGGYPQGGGPPPHMMGYFQGMPGYNMQQPPIPSSSPSNSRGPSAISIWAGDLDAYMDENFLRQAVTASGWGADITRIKVVRDHYSGMHAGYGFLDAASPEAAQRVIATGSGMPIPGTNRCWRLNMGRNAAVTSGTPAGTEINIYVGNLEPSVTDYQLMTAFRPRYNSVRHAKVVCNDYGQSRGFGFVRFASPQDAERAVSEMQGFEFNGKPIRLSPATGRTRGSSGPARGAAGAPQGAFNPHNQGANHHAGPHGPSTNKRPRQLMSPDDPNNTTIFIGGTASHITDELLWREFSSFGELDAVRVPVNKTGFAFVRFKSRECAQRAKDELSGTHHVALNPNKPVRIEWASEQIAITKPPQMMQTSMPVAYHGAANAGAANPPSNAGSSQPYDPQYNAQFNSSAPNQNSSSNASAMQSGYNNFQSGVQNTVPIVAPPVGGGGGASGMSTQPSNNLKNSGDTNSTPGLDLSAPPMVGSSDNANASNEMNTTTGETEPPTKRAAVGRSEYASANSDGALKKDSMADGKTDGSADNAPSMQFSWLNASSTQPASNTQ